MTRLVLLTFIVLGLGIVPVGAGPCTNEILAVEKAVNEPNSPYAPTARQSVGAQVHRQPTQSSVARAEQKSDSGYEAALDRARALDNQNSPDCAQAVKEAARHAVMICPEAGAATSVPRRAAADHRG
jgi:hypothetical protein